MQDSPLRSNEPPSTKRISSSVEPRKVTYKPFAQKLTFICKFCGGKSCKHENYLSYPGSAIKGLNCDWVTHNILATQRPSTRIIKEFNVIKSFKEHDINAIFNLQEPGEHPFCGDGIHPQSGFSYFPEEFYEHGIYFFNFGWKDMTATSSDVILKILKNMSFSLANGNKIAIHCHAGRGRTGLIIAAWLIYNNNMTAKEAIKLVRSKRKGAIQSKSQEETLYKLEKEIKESRIVFHSAPKFKLDDYLFHQKKLLPLSTESQVRFVPNLVLVCLERLETLVSSKICSPIEVALAFYNPNDPTSPKGEWTNNHEKMLKTFKERINTGDFQLSEIDDPRILTQSVLDYFDHFAIPAIRNQFIDAVNERVNNQQGKFSKELRDQFFKQLDKKEFFLLECFARFFSKLLGNNEKLVDHFRRAILRLSISLVLEKKKWDKLFVKRSLMQQHTGDDRVTHLTIFILKWIENFHDGFAEGYMVAQSPLRISERRVLEKMHRRGTYIDQIMGNRKNSSSSRGTPVQQVSLPKINGLEDTKQPNQDGGSSSDKVGGTPSVYGTPEKKGPFPSSFRGSLSPNEKKAHGLSEMQSYDEVKTDSQSASPDLNKRDSGSGLIKVKSVECSPQGGGTGKTNLPQCRVSLLRNDSNPFEESDVRSGSKTNMNKYDDFFAQNGHITEEFEAADTENKNSDDEEGKSEGSQMSQLSDEDKFSELLKVIDGLSMRKQDIIFDRLQKSKSMSPQKKGLAT